MTFGITAGTPNAPGFATAAPTPSNPGFGLIAAISAAPGFALNATIPVLPGFATTGELLESAREHFNEFIQWRFGGVDLGGPTVQVIDFVDPDGLIEVTRGVGDNAHVLTIKVNRQYIYFTSWLFPIDVSEAVGLSLIPVLGYLINWGLEAVNVVNVVPISGTLATLLNQYTFQLPEGVNSVSVVPNSGTLVTILNSYTLQLTEPVNVTSLVPTTGTLVVILVSYTFQLTEPVNCVSLVPISGTLV